MKDPVWAEMYRDEEPGHAESSPDGLQYSPKPVGSVPSPDPSL